MKIIKEKNDDSKKTRGVTLRIDASVMEKIDKVAEEHHVSRQKLIESILNQVISDKSFVLKITE